MSAPEVWERHAGGEGVDVGEGVIVRLQPPVTGGGSHHRLQHRRHPDLWPGDWCVDADIQDTPGVMVVWRDGVV